MRFSQTKKFPNRLQYLKEPRKAQFKTVIRFRENVCENFLFLDRGARFFSFVR